MKKNTVKTVVLFLIVIFIFSSCAIMNSLGNVIETAGVLTPKNTPGSALLTSLGKSVSSVAKATSPITPEQEYYIGRSVAASILNTYSVLDDKELTLYLNKICQVLVLNSPKPNLYKGYVVAILDSPQINAFATSGGHILVTKGLISCATTEDSLAAIIAHEIAHIQLQHAIESIKSDRWTEAGFQTLGAAINVKNQGETKELASLFSDTVNSIASSLINIGYSQSQEFDADSTALSLMHNAGYEPHAMLEMLSLLQEKQPFSSGGFAKTHPSAQNRIEKIQSELKAYQRKPIPEIRYTRFTTAISSLSK